MEGGRRGSVMPARGGQQEGGRQGSAAPPGEGAGDRRPSLSLAAVANLKGLGAKLAASVGAGSEGGIPANRPGGRKSVMLPGSSGGARRGSVAASLAGAVLLGGGEGNEATVDADGAQDGVHPGLDRIKSITRKKSAFRGGGSAGSGAATGVHSDDLVASMETLDSRIGSALQQMRSQNAAGLGAVQGLAHTRSGRLRLAGPSSSREVPARASAEEGWEAEGRLQEDGDLSARRRLGEEAATHPEKFLPRIKFIKDQTSVHEGGPKTARGRLEGNAEAGSPGQAGARLVAGAQQGQQQLEQVQQHTTPTRGSLATPPVTRSGARWGATEGGLDRLGWVRNLVQFGEYKQRRQLQDGQVPASDGSDHQPASLDTIGWLEAGAGLRTAGMRPGSPGTAAGGAIQAGRAPLRSREEVAMLQAWLQDMMAQVMTQAGQSQPDAGTDGTAGGSGDASSAASALADAALWVYGMAFEELQRQVGTECAERGSLLASMWQHVFNLVELRCSVVYESIIGAIKEELQAARRRAAASASAARAAEERVKDSMYYTRDKFASMEEKVKQLVQLLASAEDESSQHAEDLALLRRAVDSQSSLRAAAEVCAAEEHRQRVDLQHRVEELETTTAEQAAAAAARDAELTQMQNDLQRTLAEGMELAEEKARLEVLVNRLERDFQGSEIMGLSLRERLAAREAELAELSSRHSQLQQEQAQASAQLLESQVSLSGLQVRHESLQASLSDKVSKLEAALLADRTTLADVRRELSDTQQERQAQGKALQEAGARETALTAQLKQLAGAHEQQTGKLRQETEGRRNADDELQALRAGLQVTQQRLEGLGLVFASSTAHRTSAEAWRAIGPISMGRQVVAAVNQQLGELSARKAELQHDLGVAKERWQTEEAVRIRLQEQLLETKARESKLLKEREGLDGVVTRLESQRAALDAEVAQMRRMLADAESRCQSSHKKAMETANEAKRLAPLEPQVARLQDALQGSQAELERVQREVTAHQTSIRKLLDEKGTAMEQLAARNATLDAAHLQIRELTAVSKDRLALAEAKAKLEEQQLELRQRCAATERLQSESMHQLTVARRLLADAHNADERAKLSIAQQELQSSKAAVAATRRESILLKDRLLATEDQLQFMERQLKVAVHSPLAAAVAAAQASKGAGSGGGQGAGGGAGASSAVVEQLRRLLETKEERIRQLERLQSSLVASTSQLKSLQSELGERDAQVAQLQAEVDATRKRLHALQEAQAKAATKDLVALAAADPALPPDIAQSLALDYARNHLRSELAWTKAKLVFVSHMASGLRAKLQASEAARKQAELESVCVEAFYLEQGLMDQRSFAAAFDTTFVQVKRALTTVLATLAELQRQLVAPSGADLPRIAAQANVLVAALHTWMERFQGRQDQACQADPLAELADWQNAILGALPAVRPTSPPPLQHVSSIIVQLYAHRLWQLPLTGPSETSDMLDSVYEAAAQFFCERRSFSREAALSPTGPVVALLAGVRSHLQQPKQLLLGRLAGLVPSGGSGSSRSLQLPAAWQFFVRLLCCIRALQGASWDALVKEWAESEDGVPYPLQSVMDVLANLYNTDAPALLDSMRRGLVPLVRQGRRGPAVDLDAFLLVLMNEYSDGNCPISPLAMPRRLTDGAVASGLLGSSGGGGGGSSSGSSLKATLNGTVSGVAAAVAALPDAYQGAAWAAGAAAAADPRWQQQQQQQQQQQRNPMRKRIVNLTTSADALQLVGGGLPCSAAASPESPGPQQGQGSGQGGNSSRSSSPLATMVGGSGAAASGAAGIQSLQVLSSMQSLMSSNPVLPVGLRSSLRASAPNAPPSAAAAAAEDT